MRLKERKKKNRKKKNNRIKMIKIILYENQMTNNKEYLVSLYKSDYINQDANYLY